jgi:hypothetical protein
LLQAVTKGPRLDTSQVRDMQASGWATANLDIRLGCGGEDEVAVSRVKADQDFLTGIGAADGVTALLANGYLASGANQAGPGMGRQVSIHATQVKVG